MSIKRHVWAIALVAASSLVYEVLLTRVCALRLAFHFSFLVVANALLAVGAAGALLYVIRERIKGREEAWLRGIVRAQVLTLPVTYAFLLIYPAPYEVSVATGQARPIVPRLQPGCRPADVLRRRRHRPAVDLACEARAQSLRSRPGRRSPSAAFLCPGLLWFAGAGGALAGATALALAGLLLLERTRTGQLVSGVLLTLSLLLLPSLDGRFPVPSKTELRLTQEVTFLAGERLLESRWSAISRVGPFPRAGGRTQPLYAQPQRRAAAARAPGFSSCRTARRVPTCTTTREPLKLLTV